MDCCILFVLISDSVWQWHFPQREQYGDLSLCHISSLLKRSVSVTERIHLVCCLKKHKRKHKRGNQSICHHWGMFFMSIDNKPSSNGMDKYLKIVRKCSTWVHTVCFLLLTVANWAILYYFSIAMYRLKETS